MDKMTNSDSSSNSLIVVLHEIYGINKHIEAITSNFSQTGYDVVCPNFLGLSSPFEYTQQEAAYQHFVQNVGFERAATQIKELIAEARGRYKHIFLIGYSIGATVGWLCSDESNMCDGVIGYYGSRIRDNMEVAPKCPVLLLFPTQEKSFDVKAFVSSFNIPNVDVHMLDGKHGFGDPFSENYCKHSSQEANKLVHSFLQNK